MTYSSFLAFEWRFVASLAIWSASILALLLIVFAVIRPGHALRGVLWILCHTIYRLRIKGANHIPTTGPALLVCNHVTYFDWLFIVMGQRRQIRFVIFAGWTKVWGLGRLLKWAGVIPIDQWSGPRAIVKSLNLAAESLKNGEVVCIFAEGRFTRNGFLLPFNRGFEQIVKRHPAPIIPICLEQAWGSIFSYRGGKLIWKWPQVVPYPVTVAYGQPMAATSKAVQVRLAIQKMSADSAVERSITRYPVHRQFARQASRHPFRQCIIDANLQSKPLSYGRVLVEAMSLARLLKPTLALHKIVAVHLPAGAHAAIANIAIALLGKTVVNLDVNADEAKLRAAMQLCEIKQIITTKAMMNQVALNEAQGIHLIALDDEPLQCKGMSRWINWMRVLLLPAFVLERFTLKLHEHHHSDVATVLMATDDAMRGVKLTHANIAANTDSMIQAVDVRASDRLLAALPLSQAFGFTASFWLPLQVGASIVFSQSQPGSVLGEQCRKEKATLFLTTPRLLQQCMETCKPDDFKSLRLLMCGADDLPESLAQAFGERFGMKPLQGFGMNELSPAATINIPDQNIDGFLQVGNKSGTIGQPLPGITARIADPQTLEPLAPGETGLLMFCGANVMAGYIGNDRTAVVRSGWFNTGKLAKFDDDGFISLIT